ncbi:M16 family metallopeptidase [Sphingobacterium suaedae]|uniref:M16 family metallopeptidase n=1 Tax=Sphingobacterium suaedae TaxID=1686402 RepID=A0ABW5KD85_9SPHI
MLNRTIAPPQHPIAGATLIEPEEFVFENGLRVFIFQAPAQELIKAEFIFQHVFSAPENPLLHTCLSHMIKEGTTTRTSTQIADEIDFYGAYLMPEYSFDQTSLTLYTLRKHASSLWPIVHDVLMDAVIPEAELETFIRNNKQTLQISMQKNDYLARRIFYKYIFGESRYGSTPTEEAYDSLSREDLCALYRKQIQPHNCTLILSGNISSHMLADVRSFFETNWLSSDRGFNSSSPIFPEFIPTTIVEERPEALQSAIRLGCPSLNRAHADFPAVQFVNTLFGGYFGSRLMRNIREEKGYTYSIGSAIASLKHGGFFTIASEVGAETTRSTLQEIEKEFVQLRTLEPSVEELALVKNYMMGSILGSLESIFSHADKFKAVYFYGMTLDYYRHYNEAIRSMTTPRVLEIAQQYFDYSKLVKIVVGKLD